MYMGRNTSGNFFSRIPPVIKNIILINCIMLLVTYFARSFMIEKFALFYPGSPFFRPYQFVTHMFMHGGFFHLLFNMYALWMFGSVLEHVWGSRRFFLYYMLTGLGAAAIHSSVLWIQAASLQHAIELGQMAAYNAYQQLMGTPTVGASGAVYGVLLGYGMLFPNNVLQLLFPPITLKAKWFVLIFGVLELILGFSNSGGNIAHFAHVGGMIFGYFLVRYWRKKNRTYF